MTAKKTLLALVVSGAVAGVVYLNLRAPGRPGERAEVERIERRTVVGIVEASGRLKPAVSVDLSSDVIGRVVEVRPREGDAVKKGDLLIRVDPSQYGFRVSSARAALDAAESRLDEVRTNLDKARREYERDRSLHGEKLLSDQVFEAARAAAESLESQLRTAEHSAAQARAALEEAEEALRKTEIHAPRDGVVVRRNVEVGEVAVSGTLNNAGSLLLTIADLATMRAEVEVDETDVVHVAEGQKADVKLDAFPDRVFAGTVVEVARSALLDGSSAAGGQTKSADYRVKVRIEEADALLRPDLSATARITTAVADGVLAVPIQAVVVREVEEAASARAAGGTGGAGRRKVEKEGVFVVDAGHARFRPVTLGLAGERYFEVTGGLKEGALAIKGPFQTLRALKDGDAVTAEEKEAEALKARGARAKPDDERRSP